jgi:hypothetical protein
MTQRKSSFFKNSSRHESGAMGGEGLADRYSCGRLPDLNKFIQLQREEGLPGLLFTSIFSDQDSGTYSDLRNSSCKHSQRACKLLYLHCFGPCIVCCLVHIRRSWAYYLFAWTPSLEPTMKHTHTQAQQASQPAIGPLEVISGSRQA